MNTKDIIQFTQQILDFGVQMRNFKSILANGLPEDGAMFASALNAEIGRVSDGLKDLTDKLSVEVKKTSATTTTTAPTSITNTKG